MIQKKRKIIEGKKIDFVFVPDDEFKELVKGSPKEFIKDQQEGGIPVVLVSYPSLTSIVPEGVNFEVSLLHELCA